MANVPDSRRTNTSRSMPEPSPKHLRQRRLQQALMAISRAKDAQGRRLGATALGLFILLADLGPTGIYPGASAIADILDVSRSTVWRAEKALSATNLVTFIDVNPKACRYEIAPLAVPEKRQIAGLKSLLEAQVLGSLPAIEPFSDLEQSCSLEGCAESTKPLSEPSPDRAPAESLSAAPGFPHTSPAESDVKNRASKLTPEKMAWFLERPEQMDLYIRFGSDACGRSREECEATLRRSRTDWLIFKPANELYPFTKDWNDPHHAGYYWHGVCRWRARKGINLTIPQWGRLLGEITKLTRAMTSAQAHLYIFNAIHNFELVQYRIGRIGEQLILDETTLGHSLVRQELTTIISHGNAWITAEYERMAAAQQAPGEREYTHV